MKSNYKKLGAYIRPVDERNSDGSLGEDNLYGISVTKDFIVSHANLVGVTFDSYKVVAPRQFAYIPDTSRRGDKIAISLNMTGEKIIVSSICTVFEIIDETKLLPEYLKLWFMRPEFDRYARFMSNGSAREVFDWDCMCGVELPVPTLLKQKKIVRDYQVITDRIELLRKLSNQIEAITICVFNEFVNHSGDIGWKESTLGEITSFISRGIAPAYDESSSEIVLNQKCIRGHMVDFTLSRRHVPKAITEKWVKFGDLLINSTGAGTLGRTGVALFDMKNVTVDSHITVVRPKNNDLIYYLGTWGMTHESEIEGLQEGSTGQTELPRERLINMPVFLPEMNALRRFNDTVIPLFEMRLNYQKEIITLLSALNTIVNSLGAVKGA